MELEEQRCVAMMVLAGAGDALGYRAGRFEFNTCGVEIHQIVESMGGVDAIVVKGKEWRVSDDTILHNASAKALLSDANFSKCEHPKFDLVNLLWAFRQHYVHDFTKDMVGRAPGGSCRIGVEEMQHSGKWDSLKYSMRAGGCGVAMRSMCIGLVFYRPQQLPLLVAVAIEEGRMTHNNPVGFLGGVLSAVFASYAFQGVPLVLWGRKLIREVLPLCYSYLEENRRDWQNYQENLKYLETKWLEYLGERGILEADENSNPRFPRVFGVPQRDAFYKSVSFKGWGGSSGHDAPLIAYDALLGCGKNWKEFCLRGVFHGGDNDSTGCIGGALFGAMYGFETVPMNHIDRLEYRSLMENLGKDLRTRADSSASVEWNWGSLRRPTTSS